MQCPSFDSGISPTGLSLAAQMRPTVFSCPETVFIFNLLFAKLTKFNNCYRLMMIFEGQSEIN